MMCCKFSSDNDTFEAVIRLPLLEKEHVLEFLNDLQSNTMTTLRVSKTYPNVDHRLSFNVCKYPVLPSNTVDVLHFCTILALSWFRSVLCGEELWLLTNTKTVKLVVEIHDFY